MVLRIARCPRRCWTFDELGRHGGRGPAPAGQADLRPRLRLDAGQQGELSRWIASSSSVRWSSAPNCVDIAQKNRQLFYHAVRYLVQEAGIDQFIDLGCGLPTVNNGCRLLRARWGAPKAQMPRRFRVKSPLTRCGAVVEQCAAQGAMLGRAGIGRRLVGMAG
ncbi:SAM-dependent methyltransferase [Saccharopolyspora sp. NPDC000995]